MTKTIQFTVPRLGFTIRSREFEIDRDRACAIFTPRLQRKITKAVRNDRTISVIKDVVSCPYCGKEVPAHSGFSSCGHTFCKRSPEAIEAWSEDQVSFFGEEPKELTFNRFAVPPRSFVCPKCGRRSRKSDGERKVTIREEKKKITVELKLEVEDFLRLSWAKDVVIRGLDLVEGITFNRGSGRAFLTLRNESGERCATLDVTGMDIREMRKDPVIELIETGKPVYREIKRIFQKYWNGELPFSPGELNVERYILLTRFVGYDRFFYQAIPCTEGENVIEKSFSSAAKRLRSAKSVLRVFENSRLPNVKSIRRIFFTEPSLLFYEDELEAIWDLLEDVNLFRRFLGTRTVRMYQTLAYLHEYPGSLPFLWDYRERSGPGGLFRLLAGEENRWQHYALVYSTMSDSRKKRERLKWDDTYFEYTTGRRAAFSIPIPAPDEEKAKLPADCTIDGYAFVRLCSSRDYFQAGNELRNCLVEWELFRGTVYGILKDGMYVAAAELNGKLIMQAFAFRNSDIKNDPALFAAFRRWKERNGLYR